MLLYNHYDEKGTEFGDTHNCSVISTCVLTGKSYDECFYALLEAGRKRNKGSFVHQHKKAFEMLGFEVNELDVFDIRDNVNYTFDKDYRRLTIPHFKKYKECFETLGDLLIEVDGHVLAYKDGMIEDWSENRSFRVKNIYNIRRKQDEVI